MNTPMVRERMRTAISKKRIMVVKSINEEEVLATETRVIPLDIVREIRGIAKEQAYVIGFKVEFIPGMLEEKDFRSFLIESISEIRITSKTFDPAPAVALYRRMKRTPTVAWFIRREGW